VEVQISGVICRPLVVFTDQRGWLAEIFRQDEVTPEHMPVMAYMSVTQPGVARGPHAHRDQTDMFCFAGPGDFRVVLWDNRAGSPTFGTRQDFLLGVSAPAVLIVPPGVVHGYQNVGDGPGFVCNFANRLYCGSGRAEAADEIRFENDPDSPFRFD
jgi:dTDP-4-dehydrorhamnose 3,5-epimerase